MARLIRKPSGLRNHRLDDPDWIGIQIVPSLARNSAPAHASRLKLLIESGDPAAYGIDPSYTVSYTSSYNDHTIISFLKPRVHQWFMIQEIPYHLACRGLNDRFFPASWWVRLPRTLDEGKILLAKLKWGIR